MFLESISAVEEALRFHVIIIYTVFKNHLINLVMSSETILSEPLDRYECRACGYIYEPGKGDDGRHIPAGTAFKDLPGKWVCPICTAPQAQFSNIGPVGSPSGFKENLGYGIGVNALPPGKKNLLIFGVLGLFVLILLSFYGLG